MSQEYTPVEWIDETPTTQGTTINKARLDQMQTAHHYADGLKEVDSIPTEDPGVGYHMVVYCTADSTIYRWDGTQWTKDVDDETAQELADHEADHDNPHQVTKAQVGLGSVDNTSDADKPISTATAAALATKQALAFIHDQTTPEAVWNITHNRNHLVQVQVQDTAGTIIIGRITQPTLNTVTIEFNAPTAGQAIIE